MMISFDADGLTFELARARDREAAVREGRLRAETIVHVYDDGGAVRAVRADEEPSLRPLFGLPELAPPRTPPAPAPPPAAPPRQPEPPPVPAVAVDGAREARRPRRRFAIASFFARSSGAGRPTQPAAAPAPAPAGPPPPGSWVPSSPPPAPPPLASSAPGSLAPGPPPPAPPPPGSLAPGSLAPGAPAPGSSAPAPPAPGAPAPRLAAAPPARRRRRTSLPAVLAILCIAILIAVVRAPPSSAPGAAIVRYAARTLVVRARPDSRAPGRARIDRGATVAGTIVEGPPPARELWLELRGGAARGYVTARNLAASMPPAIDARYAGERTLRRADDLHAAASDGSPVTQHLGAGTRVRLAGVTADGWAEVLLRRGGVGYLPPRAFEEAAAAGPPAAWTPPRDARL